MSLGAGAAFAPGFCPTWTCMVCGEERPDGDIAVLRHAYGFGNGGSFAANVRYCADRPECKAGAEAKARKVVVSFANQLEQLGHLRPAQ